MAKVYYKLIKTGKKQLDDVPVKWRYEVAEMLEAEENENN